MTDEAQDNGKDPVELIIEGPGVSESTENCNESCSEPIKAIEKDKRSEEMNENDYAALKIESLGNIQANNRNGRDAGTLANSVLQAAMARNFDELGIPESRANSGLIATPVAGPATTATP